MKPFIKSALLLAVLALCLCVVPAVSSAATAGTSPIVKTSSSAATLSTVPTVAGLSADITSTAVAKAATQTARPTTSATVRTTTPRASTTTAAPSTEATTSGSTTISTTVTNAPTEEIPTPTDSSNVTLATPWPNATTFEYASPTEDRTPDIDPGMTPYSGPTQPETTEPTPTWDAPANLTNATPTPPPTAIPFFTAEVVGSPTFEIPPGAYGAEQVPSPTETAVPVPISGPLDAAGSSFLPRWLSYLLFIFLGISGVAAVALVGSHLGSRPAEEVGTASVVASASPRSPRGRIGEMRLLQPGAPEPTVEQQILIDRIAGFSPQSMHVERLGRDLLRLEHGVQVSSRDRSIRLGRLLILSAIPSASISAPATAWARTHGFRILSVDGSGMALVMPSLSNGGRSVLGVLPADEMVEGASPVPMSVPFTESERGAVPRPASPTGAGIL